MSKNLKFAPKFFLAISVAVAVVCGLLIPKVNVNTDMSKYLPADSRMKQGMDILESEFGQTASSAVADVRVMMKTGPDGEMEEVQKRLEGYEGVNSVSSQTADGYTLYELSVAKTVDQKALASTIRKDLPYEVTTSTSQDGSTMDPIVGIISFIAFVIILLLMSKSYLEPLLFLLATGMAVVVNMGSNALLESVSITTFSIAGMLQFALSMDYSIILMSRYRQQRELEEDKYRAMVIAEKKALPAIISSSLTTVTGLLMLVFMHLKIGMDLGIVLAKGVVCSLIFTYAALPGLILIFEKGVKASEKKIPLPNTDVLAAFSRKFRIPLTVAFVLIFVLSYQFSTRTPIRFATTLHSEIENVFPKKNTVVLLYDNEKEDSIAAVLDRVARDTMVETIYSYPTIMKKKLDAWEMVATLKAQAAERGYAQAEMLTPELMKLCYYSKFGDRNLKIGFLELMDFVASKADDPMFRSAGGPDLKDKLGMLDDFRAMAPEQPATVTRAVNDKRVSGPLEDVCDQEEEKMKVGEYMSRLYAQEKTRATRKLSDVSDPEKISKRMPAKEMSEFMGSTVSQTNMVYSFSKKTKEGMTPVEFARFIYEHLFPNKTVAKMVTKEEKEEMRICIRVMDAALSGEMFTREELDALVLQYGVKHVLADDSEQTPAEETVADAPAGTAFETEVQPDSETESAAEVAADIREEPVVEEEEEEPVVREDPRMVLLEKMLRPGMKYDAAEMARNFRVLGEKIDDFSVSMLYVLYGSEKCYDPEWKMDLKELVDYIGESVLGDDRLGAFVDEDVRGQFASMQDEMDKGMSALKGPKHSLAVMITDYPEEAPETYAFVRSLQGDQYLIGESVMFSEMKDGFGAELRLITILTILAILTIVALTFRSILTAAILVMAVMSAVFFNIAISSSALYLAYLIVQSILMGATIDYGILFTTYYREHRDLKEAYRGSIHTILTSGLIISVVSAAMAIFVDNAMIQPIVKNLAIGSFAAIIIVLFFLPAVLALVYPPKK